MTSNAAAEGWQTFQYDNYNRGVTPEAAPISMPVQIWNYQIQHDAGNMAGMDVAPITANGVFYTIDAAGVVYAIDEDSGSLIWKNDQLSNNSGGLSFEICTPLYQDGVLYVAIIKNHSGIYALNAADGSVIWVNKDIFPQTGVAAQPNTPIKSDGERLYFGTWGSAASVNDSFYCVNCADGSLVWDIPGGPSGHTSDWGEVPSGGYYWAGAALIGDYAVFGNDNASIISANKYTGEIVDLLNLSTTFDIAAREVRSGITYNPETSRIYFTSAADSTYQGYCYAIVLDNQTGTFDYSDKWMRNLSTAIESTSTPAVYKDRVYVGTGKFSGLGRRLYCLDEADGSVIWTYRPNGDVQASPAISTYYDDGDGEIYIYFTTNTNNGTAYCLDRNGRLVWSYSPPAGYKQFSLQGVAISDGKVFFGNDAGYVFALESPIPVAGFTANVTTGTAPLTVQFNDTSSGNVTSWQWDFGDGTANGTVKNPVHTYATAGTYTVTLTVSGSAGSDGIVKEGLITLPYTITLQPGWNLISLPLDNSTLRASDLIADTSLGIDRVAVYNPSSGLFKMYYAGAKPDKDFDVTADVGYFVEATRPSSFSVTGRAISAHSISVINGWNLIGWSSFTNVSASDILGRSAFVSKVAMYNPSSGLFKMYYAGAKPDKDFYLTAGMGYFVESTSDNAQQLYIG